MQKGKSYIWTSPDLFFLFFNKPIERERGMLECKTCLINVEVNGTYQFNNTDDITPELDNYTLSCEDIQRNPHNLTQKMFGEL